MKVLVIGGVAAGTKAAAKIKRQNRSAEVKILTQSADISYAGCGLPYYVGGMIESREELIVNTPEKYTGLTGVEVVTRCEVTSVNFQAKTVTALCQGQTWLESYDKLVIATVTYDAGVFPVVEDFVYHLKLKNYQKRTVGIIQNGSWGPVAGKKVKEAMETLKDIKIVDPMVTIRSALKEGNLTAMEALADALVAK